MFAPFETFGQTNGRPENPTVLEVKSWKINFLFANWIRSNIGRGRDNQTSTRMDLVCPSFWSLWEKQNFPSQKFRDVKFWQIESRSRHNKVGRSGKNGELFSRLFCSSVSLSFLLCLQESFDLLLKKIACVSFFLPLPSCVHHNLTLVAQMAPTSKVLAGFESRHSKPVARKPNVKGLTLVEQTHKKCNNKIVLLTPSPLLCDYVNI